jgi:hypothetical protein
VTTNEDVTRTESNHVRMYFYCNNAGILTGSCTLFFRSPKKSSFDNNPFFISNIRLISISTASVLVPTDTHVKEFKREFHVLGLSNDWIYIYDTAHG